MLMVLYEQGKMVCSLPYQGFVAPDKNMTLQKKMKGEDDAKQFMIELSQKFLKGDLQRYWLHFIFSPTKKGCQATAQFNIKVITETLNASMFHYRSNCITEELGQESN